MNVLFSSWELKLKIDTHTILLLMFYVRRHSPAGKRYYRHLLLQATSCKFMVNSTFLRPHFSCPSYLYNFWWHLIVNNNNIIYCVKKLLKLFSSFFLLLLFFYLVFGATHKVTWKCNYFFIRVILFVKYCLPYIFRSLK